jgi:hypothetical protein
MTFYNSVTQLRLKGHSVTNDKSYKCQVQPRQRRENELCQDR